MGKRFTSVLILLGMVSALFEATPAKAQVAAASDENVILLMLDGVRWQEVFNGDKQGPIFKNLWQQFMSEGTIFGNRDKGGAMTVSNRWVVSLPAYQSIMAGTTQSCASNVCGRVGVETVQERVKRELGLSRYQVATIASWKQIPKAVEHKAGATFVNAAFHDLSDGTDDPEFDAINKAQAKDTPPWSGARYDRYTWAHSMHYLAKHHPRFMFISLDDSDELGHRGEWEKYVETLRQYDAYIRELIETLNKMGDYGQKTTLIVTTDHGRGDGGSWKHHGSLWPSSKYVWLYARPSRASGAQSTFAESGYRHIDIRPTIEAALGLKPVDCKDCGRVMREIVPAPRLN